MDLLGDRRGQSIQIGAIILFGALIILLSTYQAFVVPDQNREVEFKHSQTVQNDLKEFRSGVISVASNGGTSSVSVELGTEYPSRVIFLNPGPPSGSLQTIGTGNENINISVANATATGGTTEVGDYWNGTTRNYSSGDFVYRPNYNEYNNAPTTVYSNTVLYNQFEDGNLTLTDQSLVNGRSISLIALNGSLSTGQSGSVSLDMRATSASATRVPVNNSGGNVTIRVPTRLSESKWKSLLQTERNGNGYVHNITVNGRSGQFNELVIEMEANETYNLKLSRVGVGSNVDTTTPATYLVKRQGQNMVVPEGQNVTLALEVRDSYNNPSSGDFVQANASLGNVTSSAESDGDGVVELEYEPPGNISGGPETAYVNVGLNDKPNTSSSFDSATAENVSFTLSVDNTDGSGTTGQQSGAYSVDWTRPPFGENGEQIITTSTNDSSVLLGTPLQMRAEDSSKPVALADVDYGVGNVSNITVRPSDGKTNASGYNETKAIWQADGRTKVYVGSGGGSTSAAVTYDRIVNESFEDSAGTLLSNGWDNTTSNVGYAVRDIADAPAGTNVSYINGTGGANAIELNYTVNTSAYDALAVTYAAKNNTAAGPWSPSENLRLQYQNETDDWVTVDNVSSRPGTGVQGWSYREVYLSGISNASHSDFKFRFRQGDTSDNDDEWEIDKIDLFGLTTDTVADLNQDPVPAFRYSPSSPAAGDTVIFDAARSDDPDGSITSYEWDFGDGTSKGGKQPTHSYSSSGTYTVTLNVTDEKGQSNQTNQTVSVTANRNDVQSGIATDFSSGGSGRPPTQTQTFTITTGDDLTSGEQISIDLTAADSNPGIDYEGTSVTTASGTPGTASFDSNSYILTYTADGSELGGDTISIDIDGRPDNNAVGESYTVTFTGADGSSSTDLFTVN